MAGGVQGSPFAPSLTVGGVVFTDLAGLIILVSQASAANVYGTARLLSASSGYAVTAGKTLTIRAIKSVIQTAAAGGGTIGYGNTDVGFASAAAPTSPVYPGGTASVISMYMTPAGTIEMPCFFQIPATKFPFFNHGAAAATMFFYGYEA